MKVQFYVYGAAYHCPWHAAKRFGKLLDLPTTADSEGNPIGAVYSWEVQEGDYCDECAYERIVRQNCRRKALR